MSFFFKITYITRGKSTSNKSEEKFIFSKIPTKRFNFLKNELLIDFKDFLQFNPLMHKRPKMVRHTLTILQQMVQDF